MFQIWLSVIYLKACSWCNFIFQVIGTWRNKSLTNDFLNFFCQIKAMKERYLPELNEMYQRIAAKLQQVWFAFYDWELLVLNNGIHFCLILSVLSVCQLDSLPQQPKAALYEKISLFKTMLERAITFLQVPKSSILPVYKEKLAQYERQIVNFINVNRLRRPVSQQQQGQVPSSHTEVRDEWGSSLFPWNWSIPPTQTSSGLWKSSMDILSCTVWDGLLMFYFTLLLSNSIGLYGLL